MHETTEARLSSSLSFSGEKSWGGMWLLHIALYCYGRDQNYVKIIQSKQKCNKLKRKKCVYTRKRNIYILILGYRSSRINAVRAFTIPYSYAASNIFYLMECSYGLWIREHHSSNCYGIYCLRAGVRLYVYVGRFHWGAYFFFLFFFFLKVIYIRYNNIVSTSIESYWTIW